MKRTLILLTAMLSATLTLVALAGRGEIEMQYQGRQRSYRLHLPPAVDQGRPLPVLFALHGGGGTSHIMSRQGFSQLADHEGFIVIYPQGLKNWNDGRGDPEMPSHAENVDDVGFLKAVLEEVAAHHPVDRRRVYATGISNGAIMSHRLGAEAADTFAAIAPVVGGLAEPLEAGFAPSHPVSVLIIQGEADPAVPYHGGAIRLGRGRERGKIVSTERAVQLWVEHNGCKPAGQTVLADLDPDDGCRTTVTRYEGGREGSRVQLYSCQGMGHTWPGGKQYLPAEWIGPVTRDFDANQVIWDFLKQHSR